ncbi:hypothetical protein [Heyndrickxia sporothermodurans]|nr:hypothetical protein [Heyndrickxia sporothermodurans]MED3656267.1 hypothetical protein [Heyndrickxia sporothermodurans]MED3697772.1 hypothetical protein [Heyndrickxia sporothermodurans]MED3781812.1 hypothetical protein [Heyndrickxia sporothermodurans]
MNHATLVVTNPSGTIGHLEKESLIVIELRLLIMFLLCKKRY